MDQDEAQAQTQQAVFDPPTSGSDGNIVTVPLGERNGTRLWGILADAAWESGVDALAVPMDHVGQVGYLGMEVARIDPGVMQQLAVEVENAPDYGPEHPVYVALPNSQILRALIAVAGQQRGVAVLQDARVAIAARASAAAVRVAAEHRLRSVLVPLVGTGHEELEVAPVVRATVPAIRTVLRSLGSSSLTDVYVLAADQPMLDAIAAMQERRPREPSNDLPTGEDLLDVTVEAESLADILLLRELQPPLAVGILGGWGSGKSFVMHLMRERMNEIRSLPVPSSQAWPDEERYPGGPAPSQYVGHVYQIEFNAWTYAHTDLWSALMQTIFTELNRQLSLEKQLMEQRIPPSDGRIWRVLNAMPDDERRAILKSANLSATLASEQGAISADHLWQSLLLVRKKELEQLETLKAERDKLEVEVAEERLRLEQQVNAEIRAASRDAAWEPMKAELARVFGISTEQLDAAKGRSVEELRRFRPPLWARVTRLWRRNRLAFVVLVGSAAAAPLAAEAWADVATVGPVALVVGAVTRMLATGQSWHRAADEKLAKYEAQVDDAVARLEATKEARIEQKVRKNVTLRETEEKLAAKSVAVEQQSRKVGPAAEFVSVADFIGGRLEDGRYEQRLGLMRQVHVDLGHLTDGLTVLPHDLDAEEKQKVFPRGPARVVLYIDDLDRCPPQRVVEVFEAIQLLLTTRLFVVVVAIDLRYVSRALESVYGGILSRFGEPSGLDYIEKIIQIPYRTRPIGAAALGRFLAHHLGVQAAADAEHAEDPVAPTATGDDPDSTPDPELRRQGNTYPDEEPAAVAKLVEFTEDEAAVLQAFGARVQLSPRAVKRLLNVSKLVKLVWARTDRPDPTIETTVAIGFLLSLAGRHGDVMRGALTALETAAQATPAKSMVDVLKSYVLPDHERYLTRDHTLWLADVNACVRHGVTLKTGEVALGGIRMRDIADALDVVGAFSFLGDIGYEPDLHPPPAPTAAVRKRSPAKKAAAPRNGRDGKGA